MANVQSHSHATITDNQIKTIFQKFAGEAYVDEVIDGVNEIVELSTVINAMGYSYEEWNTMVSLFEFLKEPVEDDAPADYYFTQLAAKIADFRPLRPLLRRRWR